MVLNTSSTNEPRSRHFERVIDQGLHAFNEAYRMRQTGVILERLFVSPLRVNVKESRISGRAKSMNAQAATFLSGWTKHIAQRLFSGALVARTGMKTREDE
jgi:hypothetical protein